MATLSLATQPSKLQLRRLTPIPQQRPVLRTKPQVMPALVTRVIAFNKIPNRLQSALAL